MIALPQLVSLNNRPPIRRDNFNRECSFVASRGGFVIHSGVHRSTAYLHPDINRDTYFAASYWLNAGPAARDAFIVQIVGEASLADAEERAFVAARPEWTLQSPKARGSQGNAHFTATRGGRLQERVSAYTLRHLHARTIGK